MNLRFVTAGCVTVALVTNAVAFIAAVHNQHDAVLLTTLAVVSHTAMTATVWLMAVEQ